MIGKTHLAGGLATAAGACLEVNRAEDGSYFFTMPAENVVIDVSFQYERMSA